MDPGVQPMLDRFQEIAARIRKPPEAVLRAVKGGDEFERWFAHAVASTLTPTSALDTVTSLIGEVDSWTSDVAAFKAAVADLQSHLRQLLSRADMAPFNVALADHARELQSAVAAIDDTLARVQPSLDCMRTRRDMLARIVAGWDATDPLASLLWQATIGMIADVGDAATPGMRPFRDLLDRVAQSPAEADALFEQELPGVFVPYARHRGFVPPDFTLSRRPRAASSPAAPREPTRVSRPRAPRARRPRAERAPPASADVPPPAEGERYYTSREAAERLAYDTTGPDPTGAIRRAVHDGRLRPVGRRGGTGPLLFTREELDRVARGDPPSTLVVDRPGAPPTTGEAHGQNEVDPKVEDLGSPDAAAGDLQAKGRRSSRASPRSRSDDGQSARDQEGAARLGRGDGLQVAARRAIPRERGPALSAASEDALLRIRRIAAREKGDAEGDQERSKS